MTSPPRDMPTINPYLHYEDVAAAVDFLGKAFGLETRHTVPGSDGALMHAELAFGAGVVMLGPADSGLGTVSPRGRAEVTQSLYVYVEDVDAHCRRARGAGARIAKEPADMFWGDRIYVALDCEGHHWVFAEPKGAAAGG